MTDRTRDGIDKLIAASFWAGLGVLVWYLAAAAIGTLICQPVGNIYLTAIVGLSFGVAIGWRVRRLFILPAFLASGIGLVISGYIICKLLEPLKLGHGALVIIAISTGVNVMLTLKTFRRITDEVRGKTPR